MRKNIKISTFALVVVLAFCTFVGCNKQPLYSPSSSLTQSEISSQKETSSVSSKPTSTSSKTASTESKTVSVNLGRPVSSKTSSTVSSSVKVYKNPKNIGLAAYHLSLKWCDSYGVGTESQVKEFTEVVEAKYFNQYFLSTLDWEKTLTEVQIIAKNGGTFWLYMGFNSNYETEEKYKNLVQWVLDDLEKIGCRDLLNGFHWDEPYYNNYTLEDLHTQMKINYTVFGLRNFPVFGLSELSNIEPQTSKNGNPMPHVTPEYSKYITDAGFDYYTVDVRENAANGGAYGYFSSMLSTPISSGKEVYYAWEDKLKRDIGHDINLWHFPCAYAMPTWAGGVAEETFCMAHLEFMAEDILNEPYPGGVALYTYHTHTQSHGRTALQERIPLKDKNGNYTHFPQQVKWESYFEMVKKYYNIFSSTKTTLVKL